MPPESVSEIKSWWEDARNFFGSYHDQVGNGISFTLDQQHYTDDNNSDPQRIKPTDPALLNLQRHKAAQILKGSEYYEMRPVDDRDDPQAAAEAKALHDQATNDPESEF